MVAVMKSRAHSRRRHMWWHVAWLGACVRAFVRRVWLVAHGWSADDSDLYQCFRPTLYMYIHLTWQRHVTIGRDSRSKNGDHLTFGIHLSVMNCAMLISKAVTTSRVHS